MSTTTRFRRKGRKGKARKNMRNLVRSVLRSDAEKKYTDLDWDNDAIPTGGTVKILNSMGGGTGIQQRIGQQIRAHNLKVLCRIDLQDVDIDAWVRVILFRDMNVRLPADPIPTMLDVLETAGVPDNQTNQQYNYDNQKRYTILFDKRYKLLGRTNTESQLVSIVMNKPMLINFENGNANSYSKGTLYLGFVSDTTSPNLPTTTGCSRVIYTDV